MELTVATWNLENLGRPEDFKDRDEYKAKLSGLAERITTSKATIVGIQEVLSADALQDLIDELEGEWFFELSSFPDDRGIRVGFLSRLPLYDRQDIVEFPEELEPVKVGDEKSISRMGRGALAVSITVDNQTIRLVTAHLKSKLISYPGGRFQPKTEDERALFAGYALNRRAAEAVTVRMYLNDYLADEGQEHATILLGDMNDEPQAATTQILVGPQGSEIGSRGAAMPDAGDGYRMFNVEPLLPIEERSTRVYRGRGEIIDHILISRALLDKIKEGSVHALNSDSLPSINDNPKARPLSESSDHAMVIASFEL